MRFSVGCMRLDISVIINLALCKVDAPLTIAQLTNIRYAERAELLCKSSTLTGVLKRAARVQSVMFFIVSVTGQSVQSFQQLLFCDEGPESWTVNENSF